MKSVIVSQKIFDLLGADSATKGKVHLSQRPRWVPRPPRALVAAVAAIFCH